MLISEIPAGPYVRAAHCVTLTLITALAKSACSAASIARSFRQTDACTPAAAIRQYVKHHLVLVHVDMPFRRTPAAGRRKVGQ